MANFRDQQPQFFVTLRLEPPFVFCGRGAPAFVAVGLLDGHRPRRSVHFNPVLRTKRSLCVIEEELDTLGYLTERKCDVRVNVFCNLSPFVFAEWAAAGPTVRTGRSSKELHNLKQKSQE